MENQPGEKSYGNKARDRDDYQDRKIHYRKELSGRDQIDPNDSWKSFQVTRSEHAQLRLEIPSRIKCNNLLNPKFLNGLCDNRSIEEITTFLISNMVVYTQSLASDISKEQLIALLKISAKACENSSITRKSYILKSTMQKKCINTICSFVSGLVVDDNRDSELWSSFINVLDYLLVILENAMQFIPTTSWKCLQTVVEKITLVLPILQQDEETTLSEGFEKRLADLRDNILNIEIKCTNSDSIRNYDDTNNDSEVIDPEEDYHFIDVYAKTQELRVPKRPALSSENQIYQNDFRKPFQVTSNEHVNVQLRLEIPSDIKSNNLLNPKSLNDLCDNQGIEEITAFLKSNMVLYTQSVASDISEEQLISLLKLSAKACESSIVTTKSYMLKSTMQTKFVGTLCSFLSGLVVDDDRNSEFWSKFTDVLDYLLVTLENAMQFIPMTCWEYLQTVVKTITLVLPVLQKDKEIMLSDGFEQRLADLRDKINNIENKFKKSESVRIYDETNNDSEVGEPEEDYRLIDVYPNTQELTVPERPFLRRNIIKGHYTSIQQYLDIHFRLMREDFLNPIREDICDHLNNAKRRLFNIKVHRNVVFLKKDVQRNIVGFQVKLEVSQALQNMIQTGQNKRFMHGTLLFFSEDNFKSICCGKVVNTDNLKKGILLVDLPFNNPIEYRKNYLMIECITFFEPYYQVLKVLQKLSQQELPMEKYILKVETNVSHPKYMENVRRLNFPPGLNQSQLESINAALNKEFVIIQGPPGTGKTFLGMALVKMLLDQKQHWGPILVICFTNHALEQFLGGLSKYTDKLVRLGHNSKDLSYAFRKYGPEGQLATFLESYGIDCGDESCEYYDRGSFYFEPFSRDFRRLVNILSGRGSSGGKYDKYKIDTFNDIDEIDIPAKIKRWLRQKNDLQNNFRDIKDMEGAMERLKEKIQSISRNGLIFIKFSSSDELMLEQENIPCYYFQGAELYCWLLCDDGTISPRQTNVGENPREENSVVEQEELYNLYNYVCSGGTVGIETYVSVHAFNSTAYELESFLETEQALKPNERKYLGEQLDFLWKKIDYFVYCLETDFGAPEVEFDSVRDPFMIQSKHRWQLYKHWIERLKNNLQRQLDTMYAEYQELQRRYNALKELDRMNLLREMDIVGMTTTCAARLRPTLEALQCPIVVVEEAAEILESHVITALTNDCQHLILLGDHQQLRPTTSDYTIERKYKLGISLFERMVQNNVECHTLNVQHRMRPEISSLISPLFYKELFNHETVERYPLVSGIERPLYFIDHVEPEELYGDSSKMNMHEAKFLIQLAIYLLNNNYDPEDITILAAYLGQSYILKKEQEENVHPGLKEVRIAVVDNFQGEENKIILLSLVRSNSENKVGFLSIDNRVCVALSRAKIGLYIMGNMTQLCEATNIWKSIRATLESQKALGRFLPLRCKNHKDHTTFVSKATDFMKVPEGGCNQPCHAVLECGHTCIKICHAYDVNHELYNCKQPCSRLLCENENHKCKKLCFDKCGRCHYPVDRDLPCGHKTVLPCSTRVDTYKCLEIIEIKPECGHAQNVTCSTELETYKCTELTEIVGECGHTQIVPCSTKLDTNGEQEDGKQTQDTDIASPKCKIESERVIPKCGHLQMVPCFEDVNTFKCQFQMEVTLKCGHKREKQCCLDEGQITCSVVCDQTLRCGHKCPQKCHINNDPHHFRYNCIEPCTKSQNGCRNPENHEKCRLPCNKACRPCTKIVMRSYTSCSHIEKLKCHEDTESRRCRLPCSKKLLCGHRCKNYCSEVCNRCTETTLKTIPECGHKIKLRCSETANQKDCKKPCEKKLSCGHSCPKRCGEPCTEVCNRPCEKELICGHSCLKRCGEPCTEVCKRPCEKELNCGHKCTKKCYQSCGCKAEVVPECGHSIIIKCGDEVSKEKCETPCVKKLGCGHSYLIPCNKPISNVICILKKCEIK